MVSRRERDAVRLWREAVAGDLAEPALRCSVTPLTGAHMSSGVRRTLALFNIISDNVRLRRKVQPKPKDW